MGTTIAIAKKTVIGKTVEFAMAWVEPPVR